MSEPTKFRREAKAIASLCDALKRLEWALVGIADEGLLDDCKRRREAAQRAILDD